MTDYSFIASTANMLLLVENGSVTKLMPGWFYGITWDTKQIYLMSRHSPDIFIWTGEDEIDQCEKVPFLHNIDDAHQILWYDDILYITNTGYNRIEVFDKKQERFYQWASYPNDFEKAPDHINSIWFYNDEFYVCEHRYGKSPARIRILDKDFTIKRTIEFYDLDCCGIHNVYIEDDILYTLSVNHLIQKHLITKEVKLNDIRSHNDIGYLRGFARNENNFYIGESIVTSREDRRKGDSSVLILDNDLQVVEIIKLKGTGQLHDIRLLSKDKAHNGLDCPKIW